MRTGKALFLSLLLASPLALAQDEGEDGNEEEESEERICIYPRNVRTFDAIDDEHIYVREGSDEHYLLTMRNRCFNLRSSQGIAFKDATSRTCSDGFGEVVYRSRMGGGRGLESCQIENIERVDSKEDAEAIVESRE